MNRVLTEQEERERVEQATTRGYNQILKDLAAEQRSSSDTSTEFGKLRKYTRNRNDVLALATKGGLSTYAASIIFNEFADNVKKAVEALIHFAHAVPLLSEHIAHGQRIQVADTMHPELGVAFSKVMVPEKVADVINQQIAMVKTAQTDVDVKFEKSGFLGPFIEEKTVYDLAQAFQIRTSPDHKHHAHCVHRVEQLVEKIPDQSGKLCEVFVFNVVSVPDTLKEYDNKVAGVGQTISASNLTNAIAAAPARPIPPPQFNIV